MALLVWSLHVKILSSFFLSRRDPFKDENLNMIFTSDFLIWPFKREKKTPSPCSLQWEEQSRDLFYSYFYLAFVFFNCFGDICFENIGLCFLPSLKDYNWFSYSLCAHDEYLLCRWNQYWQNIAACCMLHYSLSSACSSWLAGSSQLPLKWLIQDKALACLVGKPSRSVVILKASCWIQERIQERRHAKAW